MSKTLLKYFGSLKLAVAVLSTLACVLAFATFYESTVSTQAVLNDVYRSWWFNSLLALLALNVGAAALTRWPWKRRHIGFVITHAGIIVILGGCSAAFHYGTEGILDLRVGDRPASSVRLENDALTIVIPETGYRESIALTHQSTSSIKPSKIRISDELFLEINEYLPNSREERIVNKGGKKPNPALEFTLKSELAQQEITDWLMAKSDKENRVSIGPASIEFLHMENEDQVDHLINHTNTSNEIEPHLQIKFREEQVTIPINENSERQIVVGNSDLVARILGYWPDFRLDENHQPTSVSDKPNNPAVLVILTTQTSQTRHFIFANPELESVIRTVEGSPIDAEVDLIIPRSHISSGVLRVFVFPDGKLHYIARAKSGLKSGPLELGKAITPGWMDFQFTANKLITNAVVTTSFKPALNDPEGAFPVVQITAYTSNETQTQWLRFGVPSVLDLATQSVHVIYGWDVMKLPFTVRLEDFIVERNEGSDQVAGWISKVVFDDITRGLTQRAAIWMNHPAWFGGYKFSQASWNPNDLQYSALQVKKSPLWVAWLTWVGAALIVIGIILLFYFRRWFVIPNNRSPNNQQLGIMARAKEKEQIVA